MGNTECVPVQEPQLKSIISSIHRKITDINEFKNSIYTRVGYLDLKNEPENANKKECVQPQCVKDELESIYNRLGEQLADFEKINTRLINLLG